jgi:hypothetical protein
MMTMDVQQIEQQMSLVSDEVLKSCWQVLGSSITCVGELNISRKIAKAQRVEDVKWLINQGYVKLPTLEWLTEFFEPIENNRCEARDVAQALLDKMQKGECKRLKDERSKV